MHVTFRLPADPLFQGDAASLLIGMLLLRAFRALGFPLSLKWPNDLLLEERLKVGGILLEERGGVVLAGLGVNLVEAPEALRLREGSALLAGLLLPQAESAPGGDDADEPLAPFPLWRRLVSEAILEYEERMAGHEASELLADLGWLMAWKQRRVFLFEEGSDPVQGLFLGPGPSGGALLRLADREQEFFSGSLSLHS